MLRSGVLQQGGRVETGGGRQPIGPAQPLLARKRVAWAADTRYRILVGAPPCGAAERAVGIELDKVRRLLKKK